LELGVVLSLNSERVDKAVPFERFQDRLKNHVLKNYDKAEDVMCLVLDLQYPEADFEGKYAPTDLTKDEAKKTTKIKMWEMKAKLFLKMHETLHKNALKLFGTVLGQ